MSVDQLLSVSQAARMVGVPRKILQARIQAGELGTFEGSVRMSTLLAVYPDLQPTHSAMVEKVRDIRDAALTKVAPDYGQPDPERLAFELHNARLALARAQRQLASYEQFAAETGDRLLEFQERCDKRQAQMLTTLIGWFMHQHKLRE